MEKYKGSTIARSQMFQAGATAVDVLTNEEVQILSVIMPSKAGLPCAYKVRGKTHTYRAPEMGLMRKRTKTESKPWERDSRNRR